MATKNPKTAKNTADKIVDAFIDYVLTEQKEPASIYAFAKHLGIEESEFYQYYNHFSDIESGVWKDAVNSTIKSLKESGYTKESLKKKILGLGDISDLNQDTIDAMIDIIDNKDFSTVGDIVRVLSNNEIK